MSNGLPAHTVDILNGLTVTCPLYALYSGGPVSTVVAASSACINGTKTQDKSEAYGHNLHFTVVTFTSLFNEVIQHKWVDGGG